MANLPRKMGPLAADHPMVKGAETCPACNVPFVEGVCVTLITIGPGTDRDEQERCRQGRPYSGVAIAAHWTCVTGFGDDQ